MRIRLLTGVETRDVLAPSLDELHAATDTPVTARRPWLETWIRCHPEFAPLAVTVEGERDRLEAAALLARRRRRGVTEYVAVGHGPSDQVRLPARTPEAAAALAAALVDHLGALPGPWRLIVRHLPRGDPVAARVAAGLRSALLVTGDASPALRLGPDRSLRRHVSRNHHQQVRRMRNRMQNDGLSPVIRHLRAGEDIRAVLPQVEDVCRRRDVRLRGQSKLELPETRGFFRQVVLEHAARGEVELTTVHLAGDLAAYTLCFLDQGAYRVWSCKISPAWERYGAGRVANDAALRRALTDPGCTVFDWMRGEEPYKFSMCNHVEEAQDLLAWSSPAVRTVLDLRRRVRTGIKQALSRHGLQPVLRAVRSTRYAAHRRWRAFLMILPGRPR